jgi:hypothetical protein
VTPPQANEPWNDRRHISKITFVCTPNVTSGLSKLRRSGGIMPLE